MRRGRIAQHKLADYRRRGAAEDRMRARLGMLPVLVSAEDAEMIRWLGEDAAAQMVEDLPEAQRDAIRELVLEDREYAEIASGDYIDRLRHELSADGQAAFADLTRDLARRGAERAGAGADDLEAMQHLAIVIDDRIVAVPYSNFRMAPDGIDGAEGVQITGGLTRETARQTAAIVSTGPLPAALVSP
jgi:preprotein translocase subunit SecD